jgi:D-alanine--D-alanine ligase
MLRLSIICGGPSKERGISLNSARSLLDHLPQGISVFPLYVDQNLEFHHISPAQLYSNTPADFDFKLDRTAKKLSRDELKRFLKGVDLVFPVIHGAFGEDGRLQALLEEWSVPFVGSSSSSCQLMFHKGRAREYLKESGYPHLPQMHLTEKTVSLQALASFFQEHHIHRAVVKPVSSGSSIDVSSISTPGQALGKAHELLKTYPEIILEPFCSGKEFTIVVLENPEGIPVALIPTEIETSYADHEIFDFRKKYLPTAHTFYHTPPRFPEVAHLKIRKQAEELFRLFHMRGLVRLDGWFMPDETLFFTDFNPLSGLEQNSFLFRQAAVIGMNHQEIIAHLLQNACRRYGIPFSLAPLPKQEKKKPIYVLFGGKNAERQVSLMSGTNVWLKLQHSEKYQPVPFLWDKEAHIWQLPHRCALNHTVEEVYASCLDSLEKAYPLIASIRSKLGISSPFDQERPSKCSLETFAQKAKEEQAIVFLALHGGDGENGTLQKYLESHEVSFNGSCSKSSALCMDKLKTGKAISEAKIPGLTALPKILFSFNEMHFESFWNQACAELNASQCIIKPAADGCSAGIAVLQSSAELKLYADLLKQDIPHIPPHLFTKQANPIEMPSDPRGLFLLEPYLETDFFLIEHQRLRHIPKTGWVELTVGVLESEENYRALNPSLTVVEGAVLSVEEKFQGGTGVNITPPPEEIISAEENQHVKKLIEKAAEVLKIKNYARLDIFFNRHTKEVILIEANTLPALTPSTVIYQQALAEPAPIPPRQFLELILSSLNN